MKPNSNQLFFFFWEIFNWFFLSKRLAIKAKKQAEEEAARQKIKEEEEKQAKLRAQEEEEARVRSAEEEKLKAEQDRLAKFVFVCVCDINELN